MTELTKNFQYLVEKNGIPQKSVYLNEEFYSEYEQKLPKSLMDFWKIHGLGQWFGGLVRFEDPRNFLSLLALWFGADEDFNHNNSHVFASNAFGELFIWHNKFMRVKIQSTVSLISGNYIFEPEEVINPDIVVSSTFMTQNPSEDFDEYSDKDRPLYQSCVEQLGPLGSDEIFGFKLPISLGGERKMENLSRVKMKEHLMILAQTEPLKLVDYSNYPPRFVREIG